jgi:hypothetical protein
MWRLSCVFPGGNVIWSTLRKTRDFWTSSSSNPPHSPLHMQRLSCLFWEGTINHRPLPFWLILGRITSGQQRTTQRYLVVTGLVAAPVAVIDCARPILCMMRPFPTSLNQRGGGFQCRVPSRNTLRQHQQPCCRPDCRHQPCAPNPSCNKDLPSHPQQTMGGTSPPTPTTPTLSAQVINLPCLERTLASPPLMLLSSPSLLPFKIVRSASTNLGGGIHSILLLPCRTPSTAEALRKRRTCCVCRCHGSWAPNSQESHCGCRHRP